MVMAIRSRSRSRSRSRRKVSVGGHAVFHMWSYGEFYYCSMDGISG
jgi:hypothetical protein